MTIKEQTTELTARQLEVLGLVAKGYTNKEICGLLGISANTVKVHISAIFRILEVANRAEAAFSYRNLIEQSPSGSNAQVNHQIGRPTLAVLPFKNLSTESHNQYITESLAEDLIARISAWRWLAVVAYASSQKFGEEKDGTKNLAEKLNISYLITGSMLYMKPDIRMTISLMEVKTQHIVWAETFEHKANNLLNSQAIISRKIVAAIAPELLQAEAQTIATKELPSLTLWEYTAKGLWYLNRVKKQDNQKALQQFEKSVDIDVGYNLAWYGLAYAHYLNWREQWVDNIEWTKDQFHQAAKNCFDCDPQSAYGHFIYGLSNMISGQKDSAAFHFKQAIAVNPSFSQAYSLLGQIVGIEGHLDESIALLEEALSLSPLDPNCSSYKQAIALAYFTKGCHQDAISWAKEASYIKPDTVIPLLIQIASYSELEKMGEAEQAVKALYELHSSFRLSQFLDLVKVVDKKHLLRFKNALERVGLNL